MKHTYSLMGDTCDTERRTLIHERTYSLTGITCSTSRRAQPYETHILAHGRHLRHGKEDANS